MPHCHLHHHHQLNDPLALCYLNIILLHWTLYETNLGGHHFPHLDWIQKHVKSCEATLDTQTLSHTHSPKRTLSHTHTNSKAIVQCMQDNRGYSLICVELYGLPVISIAHPWWARTTVSLCPSFHRRPSWAPELSTPTRGASTDLGDLQDKEAETHFLFWLTKHLLGLKPQRGTTSAEREEERKKREQRDDKSHLQERFS